MKIGKPLLSLIAMVLIIINPVGLASAHSVLESSTPEDGEQLEESIKSIKLNFNTKVENGSTLYLVNNAGEEIQPASVEITDDVLEATFQDPLEPGSYQLNFEIVGADGHPIENQFSFSIKEPETKESEENATQTEDDQTNSSEIPNNSQKNGGEAEQKDASGQDTSIANEQFSLVNGMIILLIIAALALLAWMLLSKRKK
ncbi:copper resistance CopC family protein [Virgibacillus sp. L01]|uniref:copper resistance CopC family protein n=1 Tax=Virgibacillus sp. L01 TaxID=3457429 RepID=UPI003FD4A53A